MACPVCKSKQNIGVTVVKRKISKGDFIMMNVPANICNNQACKHVVIDNQIVKNMRLLRSKMVRGEVPFQSQIDFSNL